MRPSTRTRRDKLAAEIRAELRGILRRLDDLRQPISRFERLPDPEEGQPGYYVHFDDRPRRRIKGLRMRSKQVSLPDERIRDAVLSAAEAIWHLKDRLHQWCKLTGAAEQVEDHAEGCCDLLICADLVNWKKHGRHGNRSGQKPRLGLVKFDTSQSGVIELFYQGATKDKELLVADPVPLHFSVPVLAGDGDTEIGDAMHIMSRALEHWKPLIERTDVLASNDREATALRRMLELQWALHTAHKINTKGYGTCQTTQ